MASAEHRCCAADSDLSAAHCRRNLRRARSAAVAALYTRGHQLVVCEVGLHLFGSLLAADLVDELFLTRSPLLAGRGDGARLGLVEGNALLPAVHRDARLVSVRCARDHLFVRYELRPPDPTRPCTSNAAQHGATGLLARLPPRLLPIGPGMTSRPPARTAHRHHPALRRAPAVGLLVLLTWGLTGCGDPDGGGGGGGGGYVAQQAAAAPSSP